MYRLLTIPRLPSRISCHAILLRRAPGTTYSSNHFGPRYTSSTSPQHQSPEYVPHSSNGASGNKSQNRRITVQDIMENRRRKGRLNAPTAAACRSEMFKVPTGEEKPRAMKWDAHISPESHSRRPCSLKQAAKHLKQPGLISLGGGLPHPSYFPVESISLVVHDPPSPPPSSSSPSSSTAANTTPTSPFAPTTLSTRHMTKSKTHPSDYPLTTSLNYAQSPGSPQLNRYTHEHIQLVHSPPYADWSSTLTIGSTGGLEILFRMLTVPRTEVLADEFTFSTALETGVPMGARFRGVRSDEQGIVPGALEEVLRYGHEKGKQAKVLYVVPTGGNPTGRTMGERRRKEIYDVCERWDVIIIEDDAYYFLQYPPRHNRNHPSSRPSSPSLSTHSIKTEIVPETDAIPADSYIQTLIPSFLSLDVSGRVARLDSFSKYLFPGLRLGILTAPEQVVERFVRHSEVANQGPSGVSQGIVWSMLDPDSGTSGGDATGKTKGDVGTRIGGNSMEVWTGQGWGHDGYILWLRGLALEYQRRRDILLDACEEFLGPVDEVTWDVPRAGMFLWLKVHIPSAPPFTSHSIVSLEQTIFDACLEAGVLVARGSWFRSSSSSTSSPPSTNTPPSSSLSSDTEKNHDRAASKATNDIYFRVTFAAAGDEDMRVGIQRFGDTIRRLVREGI